MKQRILVADDSSLAREALGEYLVANGFDVLLVPDGRAAVEQFDAGPVDLVITDLEMPKVDGIAVLAHVLSRRAGVPVIVLTGYGRHHDGAARARRAGAREVLTKPIELEELLRRISDCLHASGPAR